MAIIKMAYAVMFADGRVHKGEIAALHKLKFQIGFDSDHTSKARLLDYDKALVTLYAMVPEKKKSLVQILDDIALSDNQLHEKEMNLIIDTFTNIGLGEETEQASKPF